MHPESQFHDQFAQALQDPHTDCQSLVKPNNATDQRRRFDIYRNNRASSLIESLRSTYPAVLNLVGDAFFNSAARGFIDQHPPRGPVMAEYGAEFAAWLTAIPNTESVPYLHDVALLEWHWLQAYHCTDASALTLESLAQADNDNIANLRLQPHPALYSMQSQWPIGSIWAICTQQAGANAQAAEVNMQAGESVVVTRPRWQVLVNMVPASGHLFLQALSAGQTIGDSAELALAADAGFNTGDHLAGLVSLGAFTITQPS